MKIPKQKIEKQEQKNQQMHSQKDQQQKSQQQHASKKPGKNADKTAPVYFEQEHPESRMTD